MSALSEQRGAGTDDPRIAELQEFCSLVRAFRERGLDDNLRSKIKLLSHRARQHVIEAGSRHSPPFRHPLPAVTSWTTSTHSVVYSARLTHA
jgi:hypothetical protein